MKPKCCGNCIFQHKPLNTQFCKQDINGKGLCEIKGIVELENKDVCWHYFDGSKEMQDREVHRALCENQTYNDCCKLDYSLCTGECKWMKDYDKQHGNIKGKKKTARP